MSTHKAIKSSNPVQFKALVAYFTALGYHYTYGDQASGSRPVLWIKKDGKMWSAVLGSFVGSDALTPAQFFNEHPDLVDRPYEKPPEPVRVDGKTLTPQADGSVKISCGTIIPKEDVERLFKQRAEVMKA